MKRGLVWILALAAVLWSGQAFALTEEERSDRINDFAGEVLESFGRDKESVVKALGEPAKYSLEKEPNRHEEGVEDTLETLEYDGLQLLLATVSSEKNHFTLSLTCTSERFALRKIRVGEPLNKVLKALGKPDKKTATEASYETDFITLTFELDKKGKIKKIDATLWLD